MQCEVTEEIKSYLDLIDQKYFIAKTTHVSRFSVEWGKWSRDMNVEIRKKIKTGKHPQEILLKYLFIYWINRSQLLEAYYKGKLKYLGLKKRLNREGSKFKKIILSGNGPELDNEFLDKALIQSAGLK